MIIRPPPDDRVELIDQVNLFAVLFSLIIPRILFKSVSEIFAISYLERIDILPEENLMIRKGFAAVMELMEVPSPRTVREYAVRWKPYRTVAAKLLWRAG